jgi:ring-1,2-phenylacetyl-CoA epoxidase subunit PaaD
MVINKDDIIQLLRQIPDPEIPVVDIWELGILRDVNIQDNKVEVIITPTYSGCPAMKQIEKDIVSTLKENGIEDVAVKMIYNPPWTTDWITDEAKEKLRKYGIAPPEKTSIDKGVLLGKTKIVACPHCGSENTQMISQFGSTACKALYQCQDCLEPFDYFKCI